MFFMETYIHAYGDVLSCIARAKSIRKSFCTSLRHRVPSKEWTGLVRNARHRGNTACNFSVSPEDYSVLAETLTLLFDDFGLYSSSLSSLSSELLELSPPVLFPTLGVSSNVLRTSP